MLSRDDPFPVVNLEVASIGIPIVCFENSGGTPELIADGCGFAVPYGNIHEYAEKICYIISHPKLRKEMSEIAINTIKTKYDIEIIAAQIINKIKNTI
jgi:glycosyltransferase involved in cell wall biosynthesis